MTETDLLIEAVCDDDQRAALDLKRALVEKIKARQVTALTCRVCGFDLEPDTRYCNFCSGMGGSRA